MVGHQGHQVIKKQACLYSYYANKCTVYIFCWPFVSFILSLTNVLVQEADEGGCHNIPVFTAEFQRGLDAIVHHQCQVLVDRVRAMIGELIGLTIKQSQPNT